MFVFADDPVKKKQKAVADVTAMTMGAGEDSDIE